MGRESKSLGNIPAYSIKSRKKPQKIPCDVWYTAHIFEEIALEKTLGLTNFYGIVNYMEKLWIFARSPGRIPLV